MAKNQDLKTAHSKCYFSGINIAMSIILKIIFNIVTVLFFAAFFCISAAANNLRVEVRFADSDPQIAHIAGSFSADSGSKTLRFRQSYADADNLAARIGNLKVFDADENELAVSRFADNSIESRQNFSKFEYDIDLKNFAGQLSAAHVSWLDDEKGLLQIADLLPIFDQKLTAEITFQLPSGWQIYSAEKNSGANSFVVRDLEKAVFLTGKNIEEITVKTNPDIKLYLAGERRFDAGEAAKSAAEIFTAYQKIFGSNPPPPVRIFWFALPAEIGRDRWRGETRGSTVTILSAPTTFHQWEIQRFHEQARHEFFHLWMPNNLNLSGDYAWFYEGFAQYSALKIGMATNRLRFSDFLATLSQAVAIDRLRGKPVSLLETAGNQRFRESATVYARGLLVAFFCDLDLIKTGKANIFDVLREIYDNHHFPNERADANETILRAFAEYPVLNPAIEKYIKGKQAIDLSVELADSGISADERGNLTVAEKLNRREKAILDELGYNNWRRFTRERK